MDESKEKSKEDLIIDKVEDIILLACEKFEMGEEFNVEQLQVLHDSIRILHHIKKIRLSSY